jgi:hypothetical protein
MIDLSSTDDQLAQREPAHDFAEIAQLERMRPRYMGTKSVWRRVGTDPGG